MNLGIDLGNGFTKYYLGYKFKSCVMKGVELGLGSLGIEKKDEVHYVEYQGNNYIVGDGSGIFTGEERYFTEEYKIALLTAIVLASFKQTRVNAPKLNKIKTPKIDVNLVIGLPVNHYYSTVSSVEEHIGSLNKETITVDGHEVDIRINKVTVFVESAIVIKDSNDRHVITVDIGAGTMNFTEWKNQDIVEKFTYDKSCYHLATKTISYINEIKGTKLTPDKYDDVIKSKTVIDKHGNIIDVSKEIEEKNREFMNEVFGYVEPVFDFSGCEVIQVFGGGANILFDYWKERYNKAECPDAGQYVNQQVYEAIANAVGDEDDGE